MTHDRLQVPPARRVSGVVPIPHDRSISHRFALFGALAIGPTSVTPLASGAGVGTIGCPQGLGVEVGAFAKGAVTIRGRGRRELAPRGRPLEAGAVAVSSLDFAPELGRLTV